MAERRPVSVPAPAADPEVVRALAALPYRTRSVFRGQRALSERWLLMLGGHAVYDGAAALDKGEVAALAARRNRLEPPNAKEDSVASFVASERREPASEVRLVALAQDVETSDNILFFEALDGRPVAVPAEQAWLVVRLMGGWDVTTQGGEYGPVAFWRGDVPIALIMPLGRSLPGSPDQYRWLVGALSPPPPRPARYDGALPDVSRGDGSKEWLATYLNELVRAAGGFRDTREFVVPTVAGIVTFSTDVSRLKRPASLTWWLYWRFETPGEAFAATGDRELIGSGKWNVYRLTATELADVVLGRLSRLQLPPALRPSLDYLAALNRLHVARRDHRPAWRGGRWVVARVCGAAVEVLPGGYVSYDRALWSSLRLDASAKLLRQARGGQEGWYGA